MSDPRVFTTLYWEPDSQTVLSWELTTPTLLKWSADMVNINNQSMDPLYQSEDLLQGFLGEDNTDPSTFALQLTFSSRPGAIPLVTIKSGFTFTQPGGSGNPWQINVPIPDIDTTLLPNGNIYWDLWRTDTGSRNRIAGGTVVVQIPVIYPLV